MKGSLKKHWPAILLAFCVGAVIILPTLLSIKQIGLQNFQGIYPMLSDDEDHYLASAREIYDGHYSLGNPYIKEYKSMPYTQPPLGVAYYALFAKFFHISVPMAAIVNDFLLPFLSVLLLYTLFLLLTRSSVISLSFSALFFVFFLSTFSRLVNPQLSFAFLLSGLCLIWLIVESNYSSRKMISYNFLLSLIFGVLVYIYPFYWMTLAVLYVLLTLSRAWVEKDFKYCFKNWLCFFVPALIWSTPFFMNVIKLVDSPLFQELNLRSGFISSHIPGAFTNVAIILSCLPIVYLTGRLVGRVKSWQERKLVFLGYILIIGGVILNWQNIVTGKIVQFSPHFYPVMILFACIIGAVSFLHIDMKKLSIRTSAILLCLSIPLAGIFYRQRNEVVHAFKSIYSPEDIVSIQSLSPVMNWFDENTPADSVVYALGRNLNWSIPIYTHNNLYFVGNAGLSLISDIELENRWVIQRFFEEIEEEDVKGNREIWTNKFIETYQSKESRRKILQFITGKTYSRTVIPDQFYVDRVLEADRKFKNMGFEKTIKIYEVDYIILDKSYDKYLELVKEFDSYKFLVLQVKLGDTLIYKVK